MEVTPKIRFSFPPIFHPNIKKRTSTFCNLLVEMQESYIFQYKEILSTDAPDIVKNIAKKKIENPALSFGEMLKQGHRTQ